MNPISVLLAMCASAHAVTIGDLPVFTESSYRPSPRDPFISASVSRTLLTSVEDRDATKAAPPMETYEKELKDLFSSAHNIAALVVSGPKGSAIVNGRAIEQGDVLRVKLGESLCERLLSTSQFYGLGLNAEIETKQLSGTVEKVTHEGILLRIRGAKTAIILEYRPQNEVETINP